MKFNINKSAKKPLIKKVVNDLYYEKIHNLTYKGLSNSTIQLQSNISNVSQNSFILFDYTGGVQPYVYPVLSINNNTSQVLNFSDGFLNINSTYVYHIIAIDESDDIGIVRYTVNNGKLESPIILNYGSVINVNIYAYSTKLYAYQQSNNNKPYLEYTNQQILSNDINTRIATNVDNAEIISGGNGYKLGSSFYINQKYNISDYVSNKCTLNCKLSLSSTTVSISGGTGYAKYDTFTISSAEDDGEILVTSVDSNGGILSTEISNYGAGFVSTPTITYNGAGGNGATIVINDDYSIAYNLNDYNYGLYFNLLNTYPNNESYPDSVPIDTPYDIVNLPGEAYISDRYDVYAKDSFNNDYDPTTYAKVKVTAENIPENDVIVFASDNYDIIDLYIEEPGNNLSTENIKIYLVTNNSILDLNDYIIISDSFQDIEPPPPGQKITQKFSTLY